MPDFTTPWTAAYQVPPLMGFSRQEYWSGVPSPSPNVAIGNNKILMVQQNESLFLAQNTYGTALLQAVFPTQESDPGLPHCRGILYCLSHQGSPSSDVILTFVNYLPCHLTVCKLGKARRRQWHPAPVLLPGKSHGRRNLVGCSPWGC